MSNLFNNFHSSDLYLNIDELRKIANVVHFAFDNDKLSILKKNMDQMLDLISSLIEVEISEENIQANRKFNLINTIHKNLDLPIFMREDISAKEESKIFSNTEEENNFFVAPKVIK